MKKIFLILFVLCICFTFASCSYVKNLFGSNKIEGLDDEQLKTNMLYALDYSIENYVVNVEDDEGKIQNKITSILSSKMLFDSNEVSKILDRNNLNVVIKVNTVDIDKLKFNASKKLDFASPSEYVFGFEQGMFKDVWDFIEDQTNYIIEHQIHVTFEEIDPLTGTFVATLNADDLWVITSYYTMLVNEKYLEHLYSSDRISAFYLENVKNLKNQDLSSIYNERHTNAQINGISRQNLFNAFAKVYINDIDIKNILYDGNAENVPSFDDTNLVLLTYSNPLGNDIIKQGFAGLRIAYVDKKQEPIEKDAIENDLAIELDKMHFKKDVFSEDKQIEFQFQKSLTQMTMDETFTTTLLEQIYEEFQVYEGIYDSQYALLEDKYFFKARNVDETTVFNNAEGNYRELNINVSDEFDCYIKVYAYDTENEKETSVVFSAYVKKGKSVKANLPEGDYVFKYATGDTWYGEVYMFSDTGQYSKSSQVISVHQPNLKTTITLKKVENGNFGTYGEAPEDF